MALALALGCYMQGLVMDDIVAFFCFVSACENSLFLKKKFLFRAKVMFLESATLHLKNQNPQIHKH